MRIPPNDPVLLPKAGIRIIAVAVCLAGAFAAAFFLRQPKESSVVAVVRERQPTPTELLAAIPAPTGDSAGEKAEVEALANVRANLGKAQVWVSLGDTLVQRLRDSTDQAYYNFAESAYQEALRLQPDCVDAINGMAWVEGGRHRFDASVRWAHKALTVSPDSADAYGILGDAALELGDYEAATDHYQKMMDLRPDLSSWSRGAWLLWLTGNQVQATSLMEKAIRAGAAFAENTAWCRAKLATMLMHDGAFAAAAKALEPSLRERSRNPHVLLAAARLATATRDFEVAEQYYRRLLERGPNHDALVGLGDLEAIKGKPAEAEKYYLQVEQLHAAHLASGVHDHMQMARFLADHDRNPLDALRLAEQHKLTRNVLEADTLAWVYHKNGDQVGAIDAIKRALSRHTPDPEIHYHAGMIAAAAADREAALRHLQAAIAMNPEFNPLHAPVVRKILEQWSTGNASADNR
ncbi:MAG: tetratricopeptide repeat protein [Verrucomicrobiota bacterium]